MPAFALRGALRARASSVAGRAPARPRPARPRRDSGALIPGGPSRRSPPRARFGPTSVSSHARTTTSPCASRNTTGTSQLRRSAVSGTGQSLVPVIGPRAFFTYSSRIPATMNRASSGSEYANAAFPVSSHRFASATAWTERRWFRTEGRSFITTSAWPVRSATTFAPIVPVYGAARPTRSENTVRPPGTADSRSHSVRRGFPRASRSITMSAPSRPRIAAPGQRRRRAHVRPDGRPAREDPAQRQRRVHRALRAARPPHRRGVHPPGRGLSYLSPRRGARRPQPTPGETSTILPRRPGWASWRRASTADSRG